MTTKETQALQAAQILEFTTYLATLTPALAAEMQVLAVEMHAARTTTN